MDFVLREVIGRVKFFKFKLQADRDQWLAYFFTGDLNVESRMLVCFGVVAAAELVSRTSPRDGR